MAPSATNPDAPDALAALDEIKAPAGVVLPPKEIKGQRSMPIFLGTFANFHPAILEKTAGYVARNGTVFEGAFAFFRDPMTATYTNIQIRSHPRERKA